jgi:signal transduction histidine kinase
VLERDLQEVLYVVTHELAESVHVVKAFTERLAEWAQDPQAQEFCGYVLDAAERMNRIVGQLRAQLALDLSPLRDVGRQ